MRQHLWEAVSLWSRIRQYLGDSIPAVLPNPPESCKYLGESIPSVVLHAAVLGRKHVGSVLVVSCCCRGSPDGLVLVPSVGLLVASWWSVVVVVSCWPLVVCWWSPVVLLVLVVLVAVLVVGDLLMAAGGPNGSARRRCQVGP
ncbi:hypothetical protein AK812_SmicGene2425 [Symbiodinium microadriaticum]|uniref:Uncharacterized protein n=1 Tax=Symbiodinium microadriaticum TaxID=2951 RepID=A0A1Q9F1J8_SYMMI|nr:hypothetical protein AK812_SmicGene2425 [Symbiodinium microadriaticum]